MYALDEFSSVSCTHNDVTYYVIGRFGEAFYFFDDIKINCDLMKGNCNCFNELKNLPKGSLPSSLPPFYHPSNPIFRYHIRHMYHLKKNVYEDFNFDSNYCDEWNLDDGYLTLETINKNIFDMNLEKIKNCHKDKLINRLADYVNRQLKRVMENQITEEKINTMVNEVISDKMEEARKWTSANFIEKLPRTTVYHNSEGLFTPPGSTHTTPLVRSTTKCDVITPRKDGTASSPSHNTLNRFTSPFLTLDTLPSSSSSCLTDVRQKQRKEGPEKPHNLFSYFPPLHEAKTQLSHKSPTSPVINGGDILNFCTETNLTTPLDNAINWDQSKLEQEVDQIEFVEIELNETDETNETNEIDGFNFF